MWRYLEMERGISSSRAAGRKWSAGARRGIYRSIDEKGTFCFFKPRDDPQFDRFTVRAKVDLA